MKTELEEAAEKRISTSTKVWDLTETRRNDFKAGAKWQSDQNQEDINKLISIIEWYDTESDVRPDVEIFMWFEQFKKK